MRFVRVLTAAALTLASAQATAQTANLTFQAGPGSNLAPMYTAPGVQSNLWGGIQAAIWNLLNPGQPNGGTNVNANSTEAYWLAQANIWSQNTAAVSSFDFSRWTIVTDVNAAGNVPGKGDAGVPQPASPPSPNRGWSWAQGWS